MASKRQKQCDNWESTPGHLPGWGSLARQGLMRRETSHALSRSTSAADWMTPRHLTEHSCALPHGCLDWDKWGGSVEQNATPQIIDERIRSSRVDEAYVWECGVISWKNLPIKSAVSSTELARPVQQQPLNKRQQSRQPGHSLFDRRQSCNAGPDFHAHYGPLLTARKNGVLRARTAVGSNGAYGNLVWSPSISDSTLTCWNWRGMH